MSLLCNVLCGQYANANYIIHLARNMYNHNLLLGHAHVFHCIFERSLTKPKTMKFTSSLYYSMSLHLSANRLEANITAQFTGDLDIPQVQ